MTDLPFELDAPLPEIDVQPSEYVRLLGYPPQWELRDRALELADWARAWYRDHGAPSVRLRAVETLGLHEDAVSIEGQRFTSPRLLKTLRDAGAHAAILAAVSAGPEIEAEAQACWQDGRPDEYFFLEAYGSAVVEHLVTMAGARLCAWADGRAMAVLPHYSPGYPEWDIAEQPALLALVAAARPAGGAYAIDVLESGMLRPKKSLLAVFGLTRHVDRVRRLTDLVPCDNCSFQGCQFRRVPYRRAPEASDPELVARVDAGDPEDATPRGSDATTPAPSYSVSTKALRRWTAERLQIARRADGGIDATFRYDGTTCTNMGRPLHFEYHVTLGPREQGYPIRRQRCRPADDDTGHVHMCRYLVLGDDLIAEVAAETPLQGRPLEDVLRWSRPRAAAGCYCEADSRQHKWGLVLETIHYALAQAPADDHPEIRE